MHLHAAVDFVWLLLLLCRKIALIDNALRFAISTFKESVGALFSNAKVARHLVLGRTHFHPLAIVEFVLLDENRLFSTEALVLGLLIGYDALTTR